MRPALRISSDLDTKGPAAGMCVQAMFEKQAECAATKVAVVFEEQQVTYGELNARANQLAHHLLQLGVGPEVVVGLCLDRSVELIVGVLGILKAGAAYVPLDASQPPVRRRMILEAAGTLYKGDSRS
jgi:non-ribosomal peptide synthetase component F